MGGHRLCELRCLCSAFVVCVVRDICMHGQFMEKKDRDLGLLSYSNTHSLSLSLPPFFPGPIQDSPYETEKIWSWM